MINKENLIRHVRRGEIAEIEALHKEYPEVLQESDWEGRGLLWVAIESDEMEMAQWLLDKGASTKKKGEWKNVGLSPLAIAGLKGEAGLIAGMLKKRKGWKEELTLTDLCEVISSKIEGSCHGAELILTELGEMPDDGLIKTKILRALFSEDENDTRVDKIRLLSSMGLDMNKRIAHTGGKTPLHFAVLRNDEAAVKELIQMGVDCRAKGRDGLKARDLSRDEKISTLLEAYELNGESRAGEQRLKKRI